MKKTRKDQENLWPSKEVVEQLRKQLRNRIAYEELESAWRLEALDRLIGVLELEPTSFHQLWVAPLLAVGATMDVAIACIVASYFQPN
jgi:hypothetical protein